MDEQQLVTMLSVEKSFYLNKSIVSHPRRRLIADYFHKVCQVDLNFIHENIKTYFRYAMMKKCLMIYFH